MLFNSYGFLFVFFPVTVFGYFLLARRSAFLAAGWLATASIFFYVNRAPIRKIRPIALISPKMAFLFSSAVISRFEVG